MVDSMTHSSLYKHRDQHTFKGQTKVSQIGFTFIELMIVVAIIAVLAAVSYPSYVGYVERSKRAEMMVEMQQIATRIESSKINYQRYDRIPLTAIFSTSPASDGSITFPTSDTALYTVSVTPNNGTTLGADDWTITAVPIAGERMTTDGRLTLDYTGTKCRGTVCGMDNEWQ